MHLSVKHNSLHFPTNGHSWRLVSDLNKELQPTALSIITENVVEVINKGNFSEAFLFKPRGGRSPSSGLNRKPMKNPLFSL